MHRAKELAAQTHTARKEAVWGPTKVKVFTILTLTPCVCLLIYQSIAVNALPGERNLSVLVALFCLIVSVSSYIVKREKMNEQAKQKAQEKQEACKDPKGSPQAKVLAKATEDTHATS